MSNQKNVDEQIRAALDPVDETLDELVHRTEPGLFAMTTSVMRSRHWWMNLVVVLFTLTFTALAVFVAVRFFHADGVREQIMYATGFIAFLLMVQALKLWFWMAMNRNAVLREVKRVELQVAALHGGPRGSEDA